MKLSSKFPGTCAACGCKFGAGEEIEYSRGSAPRHFSITQCQAALAAKATTAPPSATLDLTPIVTFITAARDRGLKRPKLRVLGTDGKSEMRVGLTTTGHHPGSISVAQDGEGFLGCVRPTGVVTGQLSTDLAVQQHLLQVARDPAGAAKEYAALMCKCSFCGLQLEDEGSVEVGYGPVCAKNWGLPHKPKGVKVLTPVPGGVA